jgi:hypothetical protein
MDKLTALKEEIYDTVKLLPTDPSRQGVETKLQAVHRADDKGPYSELIDIVRQDDRFDAWPESEKHESPLIKINNEYQYLFYFAETKNRSNFNKAVGLYKERRSHNLKNAFNLSAKNRAARKAVSNSANSNSANSEIKSPFTYNSDNQLNELSPKKGGRRNRTKKRKGDRTKRRLK